MSVDCLIDTNTQRKYCTTSRVLWVIVFIIIGLYNHCGYIHIVIAYYM